MFSTKPFNNVLDLLAAFPDEQSCINHLEAIRWEGTVISPCDPKSAVYKCPNNRYKCKNTNKYFNVRTGTIFEGTKIPLQKWFMAIFVMATHKRGMSSHQLAADLGITQKTAWFMLQRIRYAMQHESFLIFMEGEVEVDETFVGGKNKNRHKDKKVKKVEGRIFKDKTPVIGLLETEISHTIQRPHKSNPDKIVEEKVITKPARIYCKAVSSTKAQHLQPVVHSMVKLGTTIVTDEWAGYNRMGLKYDHRIVDHVRKQYVNVDGYTTNGIENAWTHFKGTLSTYIHVTSKHLQKYVDEYTFRYNFKNQPADKRFNLFLQSTEGKRLTYHSLIGRINDRPSSNI